MKTTFQRTVVPERDAAGRLRKLAEHEIPLEEDDGGMAMIAELSGTGETEMFVRIHSWDPEKQHPEMRAMLGQRVRVTIEVLED